MTEAELQELRDPFAELVLKRGNFPANLEALLVCFATPVDGAEIVSRRQVFAISETAQIPWPLGSPTLRRRIRYAVALYFGSESAASILVSTAPPQNSTTAFLQVAAWDGKAKVYNYYERESATRNWHFEGNSWHSLDSRTRGQGPFDSHVNGSLVMKELKAPWLHWNGPAQSIPLTGFDPDAPVQTDPLFLEIKGADAFEASIVRPGIKRWTRARIETLLADPSGIVDAPALLRHLLTTTTVNIASSGSRSAEGSDSLGVPSTFFVDHDLFAERLGFTNIPSSVSVRRSDYRAAVESLGLVLRDIGPGGELLYEQAGDAYFAWAIPERAFEDLSAVDVLMSKGVLTQSFVLAIALVDFPNPIDSVARETLMRFVPAQGTPIASQDIEPTIRATIAAAAAAHGAPALVTEASRLLALDNDALEAEARKRLGAFMEAIQNRARTVEGVLDYQRLADSRRRAFRNRRLAEFSMTLARSPQLMGDQPRELAEDGSVRTRTLDA